MEVKLMLVGRMESFMAAYSYYFARADSPRESGAEAVMR